MSKHTKLLQQQPKHENTIALMLLDGYSPEQVIAVHVEAGHDLSKVVRLILLAGAEPECFHDGFLEVMTNPTPVKISIDDYKR